MTVFVQFGVSIIVEIVLPTSIRREPVLLALGVDIAMALITLCCISIPVYVINVLLPLLQQILLVALHHRLLRPRALFQMETGYLYLNIRHFLPLYDKIV